MRRISDLRLPDARSRDVTVDVLTFCEARKLRILSKLSRFICRLLAVGSTPLTSLSAAIQMGLIRLGFLIGIVNRLTDSLGRRRRRRRRNLSTEESRRLQRGILLFLSAETEALIERRRPHTESSTNFIIQYSNQNSN